MKFSNFREEKKLWKKGYKRVACLDEAGRGPLAGPVVASASIFLAKKQKKIPGLGVLAQIKDSKKLSPAKREEFYEYITKNPVIEWSVAKISEKIIDKINIKNATELAMFRAVKKLRIPPDFLIIDGKFLENQKLKSIEHKLIVKADEKVFSCSAASIIAKVTRDRIMQRYHKKYPRYGFDRHKGYPTKSHFRKIKRYGPCRIHRRSFKLKRNKP